MKQTADVDLSFMTDGQNKIQSEEEDTTDEDDELEEETNEEADEEEEDISVPASKHEEVLDELKKAKEMAEKWKSRAKKGKYKAKKVVETKDDLKHDFEMYKQEQVFLRKNPDADAFIDDVKDIASEKGLSIEDAYALYLYKNKSAKKTSKE